MDKVEAIRCTMVGLHRERVPPLLASETAVAHLIHLIKLQQSANHSLAGELAQRAEVQVAVAAVPPPRVLGVARGQTHSAADVELQLVEPIPSAGDPHEEFVASVVDGERAIVDLHSAAGLIKLAQADDVGLEPGYVIHPGQRAVLVVLAGEYDGGQSFNCHLRSVCESYFAANAGVELGEDFPNAGHVVRRASVHDSAVEITFTGRTQIRQDMLLVDGDHLLHGGWSSGSRFGVDDDHVRQQEALVIFFTLGDMSLSLLIAFLLAAFLGLVA